MKIIKVTPIALVASLMLTSAYAQTSIDTLVVTGIQDVPATQTTLTGSQLNQSRVNTNNTAAMLLNIPGVTMYTNGGVSGLTAIHGLADDRVSVKVDGMPLLSSCPNHMNSPLSYISPSNVGSVKVITGLSPVSAGGDSLGGVVSVQSLPPVFAAKGQTLQQGEVGASYSSNASAIAGNLNLTAAGDEFSANYTVDSAKANNYTAGGNFKPAGNGLNGNVVGASRYIATNQQLNLAWQKDNHLVELKTSYQFIPFEGYANQRMDMTKNIGTQFNLKYTGQYDWGKLEANAYNQMVNHQMDDNQGARTTSATNLTPQSSMPMLTASSTNGVDVKGTIPLSETQLARVGALLQTYKLNDWWPAVPGSSMMGPNTFQNINNGTRDRLGAFGEIEQQWTKEWMGLAGLRLEQVSSNAGNIQGYNTSSMMNQAYPADTSAFNSQQHKQTNYNWDLTALSRFKPDQAQNYEAGYSRKTRSPNLYERYTWSTFSMNAIMNNFVGDGNGYVGQVTLAPEVANTFSFASDWHDPNREIWGFKTNPYYTYISNYIDAQCVVRSGNTCAANQFNVLNYVNQNAQVYGIDLSGFATLGKHSQLGIFQLTGLGSYTRGQNVTAGTNLYNIMPLNGTVGLVQLLGANWTNTIQGQFVTAKTDLNTVRNEIRTGGYSLFNLRSSYDDKKYRVNFGVENLLNKLYALPQGGAYLGQGPTMTMNNTGGSPWGTAVAGMGRTFYVSANMKF
jgi:iron complex outermembrane receptor protein